MIPYDFEAMQVVAPKYATNYNISYLEKEIIISFFSVMPIIDRMPGEETHQFYARHPKIPIECVGRIMLNPERAGQLALELYTTFMELAKSYTPNAADSQQGTDEDKTRGSANTEDDEEL